MQLCTLALTALLSSLQNSENNDFMSMDILPGCMSVPLEVKRRCHISWAWATIYRSWDLNQNPLGEHPMLLTAEPSVPGPSVHCSRCLYEFLFCFPLAYPYNFWISLSFLLMLSLHWLCCLVSVENYTGVMIMVMFFLNFFIWSSSQLFVKKFDVCLFFLMHNGISCAWRFWRSWIHSNA